MLSHYTTWKEFEIHVGEIFKLFGYQVEVDTKVNSAQTDVIAFSKNRLKPNILVECKFKEVASDKIGINDVENFIARVISLRNRGKIDKGYLITNADFTSSAKECITEFNSYVFLSTARNLINELIDLDVYLQGFINDFEATGAHEKFVDLTVCDTPIAVFPKFYYSNNVDDILNFERNRENRFKGVDWNTIINPYKPVSSLFTDSAEKFLGNLSNLMLLLGDFGAGKTTCLKYLMYKLAKARINSCLESRVPLLIQLREYNKAVDIDSLIQNFLASNFHSVNISVSLFHRLNTLGYFALILDGFDEMAKLVTASERRYTFQQIAKLITGNSKVILSSRPGYFVSNDELIFYINRYVNTDSKTHSFGTFNIPMNVEVSFLQQMDIHQLNKFLELNLKGRDYNILNKILENGELITLAKRPVLANIIIESVDDIFKGRQENNITLALLYEIYTRKWTEREEDKGLFRILIDSGKKSEFISLLAIQMFEQNTLAIHYSKLDSKIQKFFKLTDQSELDHFSHDIRTCSFLERDSYGNYSFIHKSFMEFFIAKEISKNSAFLNQQALAKYINKEVFQFLEGMEPEANSKHLWEIYHSLKKLELKALAKEFLGGSSLLVGIRTTYEAFAKDIIIRYWPKYDKVPEEGIKLYFDKIIDIEATFKALKKSKQDDNE